MLVTKGPYSCRVPDLAAAEERWRLTLDNAPVGIALVSLEGKFLRVNEALCQMLGHTSEELHALDFQSITHPAASRPTSSWSSRWWPGSSRAIGCTSATCTPTGMPSGPTCR